MGEEGWQAAWLVGSADLTKHSTIGKLEAMLWDRCWGGLFSLGQAWTRAGLVQSLWCCRLPAAP